MSTDTSIEWTDRTWNPVRGCSRVSPGCERCYAERVAMRFSGDGQPYEGLAKMRGGRPGWTGEVRLIPSALAEPLRWRTPRRVFVNSMSDLFHEKLANEEIAAVFGVMAAAPQHTFQVLTKRAERMRAWFEWIAAAPLDKCACYADDALSHLPRAARAGWFAPGRGAKAWPLPNVWLGATAEDQKRAEERIPHLLATPAAVRFLSCEPLLGPVDLDRPRCDVCGVPSDSVGDDGATPFCNEHERECSYSHWLDPCADAEQRGINWVIVGGESGPGARPCALEWIEAIVEQCREAGVACFVKQLGAVVTSTARTCPPRSMPEPAKLRAEHLAPNGEAWAWRMGTQHAKGGDPSEWPDELRVRQFPGVRS